MGFLENLGSGKIGGSINAQFQTDLAVERFMISTGQQVGGYTSFLRTLEFIGGLILLATGIFIISIFIIIHTTLFLCRVYRYLFPSKEQKLAYEKAKANGEFMTDEELAEHEKRFELTPEDIEEINNYH